MNYATQEFKATMEETIQEQNIKVAKDIANILAEDGDDEQADMFMQLAYTWEGRDKNGLSFEDRVELLNLHDEE